MINDSLSDMLTRLRNGCAVRSATVVLPLTRLNQQICQILEKEGYIASFRRISQGDSGAQQRKGNSGAKQKRGDSLATARGNILLDLKYNHIVGSTSLGIGTIKPSITNLRRLSKPGARIYTTGKQMPKVFNGIGIIIVSTSQGIMTDREARSRSLGGELLCSIW